ncbi:AAA family ATPase [Longispora albida]|uniref:AAA family ATPase n=1 Tax=Longispora albida TaxID=203523 RepID=UPI00037D98C6|nr:ATP-binding protein [Longispora albida]
MFAGRRHELATAADLLGEAAGGAFRMLHVTGAAGVGKTAVAEKIAVRAAEQGFRVVWGRARGTDPAPPYALWAQVAAVLGEPLPWLGGSPAPDVPAAQAKAALLHSFAGYVRAAASASPLLVVLDDLHEADPVSLTLVGALGNSLDDCRVMVVTTQRPAGRMAEVNQHGTVMAIPPLLVAEVAELVAGHRPELEAWAVYRAALGNAYRTTELLSRPEQAGRPMTARLSTLDADTRSVVAAGAVLGQQPAARVLAVMTGLPPGRFTMACARAAEAGLPGEEVYAAVPRTERLALHHRAAEVLVVAGGSHAEVAHHLRKALPEGDPARATEFTVLAARAALPLLAPENAIGQCDAGLAAIGRYEGLPQLRARLLAVRGEAWVAAGDPGRGIEDLTEAIAISHRADNPVLAAEAALALPHTPELSPVVRQVLGLLGSQAPGLRARLLAWLASAVPVPAEQRALFGEAAGTARRLDDGPLLAGLLHARLSVLWALEPLEDRLSRATEIVELAVRHGLVSRELDGRLWRLTALLESCQAAQAGRELATYEALAERTGHPGFLSRAGSARSMMLALAGRFRDAGIAARAAREHAVAFRSPGVEDVFATQMLPLTWAAGGRYSVEFAPGPGAPLGAPLVEWLGGNIDAVRSMLGEFHEGFGTAGPFGWALLAEMAFMASDAVVAAEAYRLLLPSAGRAVVAADASACLGSADRYLGLCALTAGDVEGAAGYLRAAVAANERLGAVAYRAASQADLATALTRRAGDGDEAEAEKLVAAARATAAEYPMVRLARIWAERS